MKVVRESPCIIFYRRHLPKLLRFYSLDEFNLSFEGFRHKPSPYAKVVAVSPIETMRDNVGIDGVTVHHFNISMAIELLLSREVQGQKPGLLERLYLAVAAVCRPLSNPVINCSRGLALFCGFPVTFVGSPCLKDISAVVQQLDVRAEQAEYLVNEVGSLNKRASISLRRYSALYTGFYNIVWLLINDFAIGYSFGVFIGENADLLADMINQLVETVLVEQVQWILGWLNSWPAGLKLNTELSRFYAHTFVKLIALWGGVLREGGAYLPHIISVVSVLSFGGTTMLISSCMDLLSLMTLHLYICYVISNFIYRKMLQTAGSLWRLFRGKRYNVLRNRTDKWEYDMDQLIFGTILFTLLAFLFPTVLAYYTLFALLRFATVLLQACLETLLAFMNHFPLFALLLRIKDPWRLPGGIYFNKKTLPNWPHPVLIIENTPISLSSIFFQYGG
ncbi:Gpi1-domain-containing protein [Pluteus cervinus]|uniref:Gpi1-domain-containing protein n=1 Tax=Pluteus cervinus TaxID=181527 RepID=A0ACD3ATD3_9AGAR|nr:Gpi1-domain-containing protein [Pluteus cervinus]